MTRFKILFLSLMFLAPLSGQDLVKPPIVPYWAFGHWIWEDTEHTQDTVLYMVNGYLSRNIRVNAVIFDSPWETHYNSFDYDPELYPDLPGLIDYLHSKNIKAITWYAGTINRTSSDTRLQKCPTYDYTVQNNFTINKGKESRYWKGMAVHVDFTNPKAVDWWHKQVDKMYRLDIDGAKIEHAYFMFGDTVLTLKGKMTSNNFSTYYYADAFDYALTKKKDFLAFTHAYCNGTKNFHAPINKCHVNWVGDFLGTWEGIKEQVNCIYKSADYGYIAPGYEIGGYFAPTPSKKEFIRGTQTGCFMPVMINGGNYGSLEHHLPWHHDSQTVDIYKKFVDIHYRLSPYLFSLSVDGHHNSGSILQKCNFEQESHQLGNNIFIKAITSANDTVSVVFPPNYKWIDYWDNENVYSSSDSLKNYYPLDKYPVFIRSGAIIPVLNEENKVEFTIYPEKLSSQVFHRPTGTGIDYHDITINFNEENGKLMISSDVLLDYTFKIICFQMPDKIVGADTWDYDNEKNTITINKKGTEFSVSVKGLKGYSK